MFRQFPRDPDFELIRQPLPLLNKTHDELHRTFPHYREQCRRFRDLALYLFPAPFKTDPLADPPDPRHTLLKLRNEIGTASDMADALFQMERFNAQATATCAALSAWADREAARAGH